jgi:hypothetical protein
MTDTPPTPANDNRRVLATDETPADGLAAAARARRRLLAALLASPGLELTPGWRQDWDEVLAFERCVCWRYYEWAVRPPG